MDYCQFSNDYLLMLLKQSDSKAFEEIYNRYWKVCFKYAIQKIEDISKVEDICHDVFLSIWQRRETIDILNLEAYLIQSIKYAILRIKQADIKSNLLSHQLDLKEDINETEYKIYFDEMNKAWHEGLDRLPEKSKEVFVLSRLENLTNKEIGEKLSISEKGVEYHISKAIKFLREYLKDYLLFFISFVHIFYVIT